MKWGTPFDPATELIWVGARIVGRQGLPAQLLTVYDTGTARTLVERRVAEKLGLTEDLSVGDAFIRCVGGPPLKGFRVTAPEFAAFGRVMKDFEVVCVDLTEDLEVEGLIGLDFVRGVKVMTDFQAGLVTLES